MDSKGTDLTMFFCFALGMKSQPGDRIPAPNVLQVRAVNVIDEPALRLFMPFVNPPRDDLVTEGVRHETFQIHQQEFTRYTDDTTGNSLSALQTIDRQR